MKRSMMMRTLGRWGALLVASTLLVFAAGCAKKTAPTSSNGGGSYTNGENGSD
jgi:hypothetical protein